MSRFQAYLRNAASLIKDYDGGLPLSIYLKQFFAAHKKFGSSDRKQVGGLVHQYYRASHLSDHLETEEGIILADLLCHTEPSPFLKAIRPHWISFTALPLAEKLRECGYRWEAASHTPWLNLLQKETDVQDYTLSHFVQPDLFLRVRPAKSASVKNRLNKAGISFFEESENCLRLPNGSRLDDILSLNKDVVVQDKSSQQCGTIIQKVIPQFSGLLWDVCAASGGKSIMLHDMYKGSANLLVSDIRESILHNLRERFAAAGISRYKSFTADLTRPLNKTLHPGKVDMVLVDAPCSGSGTWARTPEQHYFFNPEKAAAFSETQFAICSHALPVLKSGGIYIYITCSVFYVENQSVANRLQTEYKLELLHDEIINGSRQKADSLYLAIFRKP